MDTLHLEFANPKAFILAARGSAGSFSRENDQVWELEFNDHNVHPISLHTTYGLRAREMRLFPTFTVNNKRITSLRDYASPPAVTRYLPDAFRLESAPIHGLITQWEGYFPECDTVVGTVTITNNTANTVSITLALAALLVPMRKGTPMHPDKDGINQIIAGQSGALNPVLFMTGGPNAVISPFPSLVAPVQLEAGQIRRLTWALVTKDTPEASLAAARRISAFDWRSAVREKALEQKRQTLHIRTGNPDWDAAFFLSQVQAQVHAVRPKVGSPPLFLRTRLPGESVSTEFRDPLQADLTLLETQHLFQVLAPSNTAMLAKLLDSFLNRITENDLLPSQLFRSVQNKPVRECPVLAQLYLQLHEYDPSLARLEAAFPRLCRLFDRWFKGETDQEDSHLPIWDDPRQCQCETGLFHFDIWEETGHGMDISFVLSPALLAMLSSEAAALSRIAKLLKDRSAQKNFNAIHKTLHNRIQSTWNERLPGFSYQDSQSHEVPDRELYFPGRVQPKLEINKVFLKPQRLQLHLSSSDENTRVCRLTISGRNTAGEPIQETIKSHQLRWVMGRTHVTTTHCYQSIESLTIEGLKTGDRFLLETADFSQPDVTCFLPFWSGDAKDEQGTILLGKSLDPEAESHAFGIPETWAAGHALPQDLSIETNVLWNTLILSGLLRAGQQETAAAYFTNLMTAVVKSLRNFSGFFAYYSAQTGQPVGPRNLLAGLAPLQLFLSLAGIRVFSPWKVAVWGRNPFPGPVEVHWQGLSIRRDGSNTLIVFPDGARHEESTEKPLVFEMKAEKEMNDA